MSQYQRKKGAKRTARHGGSPSSYTKRNKKPYKYSTKLLQWMRAARDGNTALRERLNRELCLDNGINVMYTSRGKPIYLRNTV